jgi:hypothetical protein
MPSELSNSQIIGLDPGVDLDKEESEVQEWEVKLG